MQRRRRCSRLSGSPIRSPAQGSLEFPHRSWPCECQSLTGTGAPISGLDRGELPRIPRPSGTSAHLVKPSRGQRQSVNRSSSKLELSALRRLRAPRPHQNMAAYAPGTRRLPTPSMRKRARAHRRVAQPHTGTLATRFVRCWKPRSNRCGTPRNNHDLEPLLETGSQHAATPQRKESLCFGTTSLPEAWPS